MKYLLLLLLFFALACSNSTVQPDLGEKKRLPADSMTASVDSLNSSSLLDSASFFDLDILYKKVVQKRMALNPPVADALKPALEAVCAGGLNVVLNKVSVDKVEQNNGSTIVYLIGNPEYSDNQDMIWTKECLGKTAAIYSTNVSILINNKPI